MDNHRAQSISLLILLGLVLLFVGAIVWPFLRLILLAGIFAILFYPIFHRFNARIASPGWSAFATVLLILIVVLIPLSFVGRAVVDEVVTVYNHYQAGGTLIPTTTAHHWPHWLQSVVDFANANLHNWMAGFSTNAFKSATAILSNVGGFMISFFLVLISVYYLLRDGRQLREFISSVLPLSREHEQAIADQLEQAIKGVVQGSFLTSLAQGTASVIGFYIFHVPSPFLWAIFVVLAAFVPTLGTTLSLGSACAYLLITGHIGAAIGLAIWSLVSIGTIDNIFSPRWIGSRANLHPLLILFSILGGIEFFGLIGFLIGPILMALLVALMTIYRREYAR